MKTAMMLCSSIIACIASSTLALASGNPPLPASLDAMANADRDIGACRSHVAAGSRAATMAVAALEQMLSRTITEMPRSSGTAEIQAALLFALDQARSDPRVTSRALESVDTASFSPAAARAIKRLRVSHFALACSNGTAGLQVDSALTVGPDISGGGLSSDYARP